MNTTVAEEQTAQPDLKIVVDNVTAKVDAPETLANVPDNNVATDLVKVPTDENSSSSIDLDKLTAHVVDPDKKLLNKFQIEIQVISMAGYALRVEQKNSELKHESTAVSGLAKILGVYHKYFNNADTGVTTILMDELYKVSKVKLKTVRTTAFHLLSRIYRDSDRKQASSDAKILIQAHEAKRTEQDVAEWVKGLGGLNKIKNGIAVDESKEKQSKALDSTVLYKRVLDSIVDTHKAKLWTELCKIDVNSIPDQIKDISPSGKQWKPIVVKIHNGEMCFYELNEYPPEDQIDDASNEDSGSVEEPVV